MGALLGLLRNIIFGLAPKVLKSVADKLGTLISAKVAPTASAIWSAIKTYVGNNPGKVMTVFSLLSSLGIDIAMDKVQAAAKIDDLKDPQAVQMLNNMFSIIDTERSKSTGDGNVVTIHGMSKETLVQAYEHTAAVNAVINDAVAAVGSFERLMRIRRAIFLEDFDFDMYKA